MSYAIELANEFLLSWRALPIDLGEAVLDALDHLPKGPTHVSRPTHEPNQRHQLYRFRGNGEYRMHWYEIKFQYGQDEQTLHIIDVSVRPTIG